LHGKGDWRGRPWAGWPREYRRPFSIRKAEQQIHLRYAFKLKEMYYLFMSFVTNVRIEPESDSN
jgi:hypothetical protein